ncbi:hypothetical protein GCM10020000_85920 [Streptomyces olivoverticillatus]
MACLIDDPDRAHPLYCNGGYGFHPLPEIAAVRALAEAAQSRLTYIQGSRHDLTDSYTAFCAMGPGERADWRERLLARYGAPAPVAVFPTERVRPGLRSPQGLVEGLLAAVVEEGLGPVGVHAFAPLAEPFHVVRIVVARAEHFTAHTRRFGPPTGRARPGATMTEPPPAAVELLVGPTAYGLPAQLLAQDGVRVHPPARRGSIAALIEGLPPGRIALVDGRYDDVPAVGHREILDALAAGWQVTGLGSLGALRAAELNGFRMSGYGRVFAHLLATGAPDDEVALLHGPAPDYRPITEALVDLRAFAEHLVTAGVLSQSDAREVINALARPVVRRPLAARLPRRRCDRRRPGCGRNRPHPPAQAVRDPLEVRRPAHLPHGAIMDAATSTTPFVPTYCGGWPFLDDGLDPRRLLIAAAGTRVARRDGACSSPAPHDLAAVLAPR